MEPTEGANPLHTPRMAVWFLTAHAPVSSATQADIQPLLAWSGRRALRLRLAASSEEWLESLPERLLTHSRAKRSASAAVSASVRTNAPASPGLCPVIKNAMAGPACQAYRSRRG